MKQSKDRRTRARLLATVTAVLTVASVPLVATPAQADTVRSLSWHLDSLRIPRAQEITKGAGVTVAVVDGGVQADNQDLVGQVVPGKAFANDVAPDGRTDPDQNVSHGTGMSSLIAGRGGGPQRMLGIAPEAKIMPAAVGMAAEALPEAIRFAADQHVGVISISMEPASVVVSPLLFRAIAYAQQRDVVVVASAGNKNEDSLSQIASQPGVVSVAAVDRNGKVWGNSSRGPELAVSAPGVNVIMSVNAASSPNGYGVGDGTSPATAIVAGVVALIRARFPDLNAANVVNRLITTTTDKGKKGRDSFYGFGIIDPVRALTANIPPVDANPLGVPAPVPDETGNGGNGADNNDDGDSSGAIKVHADWGSLLLYGLGCLAVVAVIVILIVWLSRRRRRVTGSGPPGQRYGSPAPGPWHGPPPTGVPGSMPPGYVSPQQQQPHYPPPPPQHGYGPPPTQPSYGPPPGQPVYGPPGRPGQAPAPQPPTYGPPQQPTYPPPPPPAPTEQRQPPPASDR
ncbi:S8 family serine peptidase [Asanoa sp. NPDC049573]|uniref:S8 family serine peptidase n=1 Tax=Asanoa sp. NPDC049573 TaxID=3155396 RepID=UPI0034350078